MKTIPLKVKKTIIAIFVISFLLLTTLLYFSFNNFAQTAISSQGVEVSPPSNEFNIDPGETIDFEVKVRNRGTNQFFMRARIEDFTASGDEGQVELVEKGPYSISSWTTLEPKEFSLNPSETKTVRVRANIPEQNVGGGRYGAVVFGVTSSAQQGNSTAVAQEIASLFLLRVAGPVEEKLDILNFTAPQFAEFGPVPLKLRVFNNGNIHVKTAGIVSVSNVLGRKVADLVIPPTNIFPQANRVLEVDFSDSFLIGPYQARAVLFYGQNNASIEAFVPFFVFPVRLVAGVVGLIALIAIIFKYARRKSVKKQ